MKTILNKEHENDWYDRPIWNTPIYSKVYKPIYDMMNVLELSALPENRFRMEIELENLILVQISDFAHNQITSNLKITYK